MSKLFALNYDHVVRYRAEHDAKIILPDHSLMWPEQPITTANSLQILVWNIFKQKRLASIDLLEKYAGSTQLILLQEAQNTGQLINFVHAYKKIADQVPAYSFNDLAAGVMTISDQLPLQSKAFRAREPLIRIPKSALVTLYKLPNYQKNLLVVNVHAINFSFGVKIYHQQIKILLNQILSHDGPLIVAGDFNAWSRKRIILLYHLIRKLNLKTVRFKTDLRKTFMGKPLDFVFYRHLTIEHAEIIHTDSSDHNPLLVKFLLNK